MKTTSKEPAKKATATKSDKTSTVNAVSKSTKHTPPKPVVNEAKTTHRTVSAKDAPKTAAPAATTIASATTTATSQAKSEKVVAETNRVQTIPSIVTHETIAMLAYQLWQSRGWHHGHDVSDWIEAERQLQLR
jgi:hypothetical protein